jgi:hypothetical protein
VDTDAGGLRIIGNVQRLALRPGDVVVVLCDGAICDATAARLRSEMQPLFPDNKVLVLGDGLKIAAVGAAVVEGDPNIKVLGTHQHGSTHGR